MADIGCDVASESWLMPEGKVVEVRQDKGAQI